MSRTELLALKRRFAAAAPSGPVAFSVEAAREFWYPDAANNPVPPELFVHGDSAGGRTLEWLRRRDASEDRAIVYLHGGGYVCGSIGSHRPLTSELARTFSGSVVSVEYRLAPEHPYPAAVEDVLAAYETLLARGIRPGSMAFAGDSAGGGLVLAALVALRERGRSLPAAAVCLSPWVDLATAGASIAENATRDGMVRREALEASGALYRGKVAPGDPRVSPLHADLRGLPPTLIQVGSGEILLDDALRLARVAAMADVDVVLEIWPEMPHVWHLFAAELGEARAASARVARWVDATLSSAAAL